MCPNPDNVEGPGEVVRNVEHSVGVNCAYDAEYDDEETEGKQQGTKKDELAMASIEFQVRNAYRANFSLKVFFIVVIKIRGTRVA